MCVTQQQPQIVLLREGTDTSQGKGQLISNINACMAVVDSVRTTLVSTPHRSLLLLVSFACFFFAKRL